MLAALRRHVSTIFVAMITAAVTAGGPAIAATIADYAKNSDKVDGRDAVSAGASRVKRAGKLVATNTSGRLPNNIVAKPADANRLDGLDSAAFQRRGTFTSCPVGSAATALQADGNLTCGGSSPSGPAGGSLQGTFPDPTLAKGAVAEAELRTFSQRSVASTSGEVVAHYFFHALNGVTSVRVTASFNGDGHTAQGTLLIKQGTTTLHTYVIPNYGTRAWTYISPAISVSQNISSLDIVVQAHDAADPVLVRDIDLEI